MLLEVVYVSVFQLFNLSLSNETAGNLSFLGFFFY